MLDEGDYDQIEKEFWNYVENTESEPIKVEYAADLPIDEFGVKELKEEHKIYANHSWNLNKMYSRDNSLLQF